MRTNLTSSTGNTACLLPIVHANRTSSTVFAHSFPTTVGAFLWHVFAARGDRSLLVSDTLHRIVGYSRYQEKKLRKVWCVWSFLAAAFFARPTRDHFQCVCQTLPCQGWVLICEFDICQT
jgi:hypothetical protein